jgi:hypothetical protein
VFQVGVGYCLLSAAMCCGMHGTTVKTHVLFNLSPVNSAVCEIMWKKCRGLRAG